MIVVNGRAGQRSNRLVVAAHAMATAIERGERLMLTTFDEFKDDYVCKPPQGIDVIIARSRFWEWVRLVERAVSIFTGLMKVSVPHILTIASNWYYRDNRAVTKHEDTVREFFSPVNVSTAKKSLAALRQMGQTLVGVHIRRRDYKKFLCGRYFYGDEVYFREMYRVRDMLGKDVLFAVFSDEEIEESHFAGLPCQFMHGSAVEDQWMMSQCDYLMGPPSTFSAWASFMGKVPLARMWDKDYELKREDFAYRGLVA